MSNALAIAAVTATLRNLVLRGVPALPNQNVTTKPLDVARAATAGKDQINIFLYQTALNSAWRNMDMPGQTRGGETAHAPLALNLYYLVTAFGQLEDDAFSHRWLGEAMSVFHDHPLLGAKEIQNALLPEDSGLQEQLERVRITPQSISVEEMSKLWTIFQTQYRISTAYQVEVVLIESTRSGRTPLPVLTRGKDNSGIHAQGNLVPPFPAIDDIRFVDPTTGELESMQPRVSVQLGDRVAILGHHLAGPDGNNNAVTVTVRLNKHGLDSPLEVVVPAADRDDRRITFQIPNAPANCPAGPYLTSVHVMPNGKPEESRETSGWPLLIAPTITSALPMNVARTNVVDGLGDATIALSCKPDVQVGQRVSLTLGNHPFAAEPMTAPSSALSFVAKKIPAGEFRLRLRVDGVDSHIRDFSDPDKAQFDETRKVTIT
jgi:hypothetical protein